MSMHTVRAVSGLLASAAYFGPIMMDASAALTRLEDKRTELFDASQALIAAADEAERELTDDELQTITGNTAAIAKIDDQISVRAALETPSAGRRAAPEAAVRGGDGKTQRKVAAEPRNTRTFGFQNLGEFAMTVKNAAARDESAMNRLVNVNMSEGVGEDGGFLVPPEYRDGIMKVVEGEESLLSRCDMSTTARNSVIHPKDETTPWGTSGIRAYWEGEASSVTAANAKFQGDSLRLNKLYARVDCSDELLDDAPQLDNYLRVRAPEVMTSVLNLAIVQGNGVGKPLGIMNSGCLVTVAAETSQPADSIHHRNLVKMMGRMHGPSWTRAVWLMHQDVWAQLHLISFRDVGSYPSVASGTAVPVFVPPGGISGAPYGTLLGRPIVVLQAMETIGDLGDIILADMSKYRALTKAGGARVDTSIHLKFDTDETVFRFIFRVAGAPWWSAPISPRDGSNTLSPFVTLASR